jgi:hypothetical protein
MSETKVEKQDIVIGIKILELTDRGLHEVFEIETEELDTKERVTAAVEKLVEMAFENDSFYLTTLDGGIVIRGLKNKTIKFEPVYKGY